MNTHKKNLNQQQKEAIALFRLRVENGMQMTEEDWQTVARSVTLKTAGKNVVIHEAGKIEKWGRFIVKGVFKITFYGEEPYVYDFRRKGDYLCDDNSVMNKTKSSFTFKTLTECEWLEGDIYKAAQLNKKTASAFSRVVMEYLNRGYERTEFLRINNAEERYTKFCIAHADVVKYAKLGDIASYLDLTPQSLSRIRKNLVRA